MTSKKTPINPTVGGAVASQTKPKSAGVTKTLRASPSAAIDIFKDPNKIISKTQPLYLISPAKPNLKSYLVIGLQGPALTSAETPLLTHSAVAGIVLFSRNVQHLAQLTQLVTACRAEKPELLFFIDHEGIDLTHNTNKVRSGVWRTFDQDTKGNLKSIEGIPAASTQYRISQSGNLTTQKNAAFTSGQIIAQGLAQLGIHPLSIVLDSNPNGYAPSKRPSNASSQQTVTDAKPGTSLNNAAQNDETARIPGWVIHGLGRSFGQNITALATEKARGISSFGLARIVKHWPDHGNARDTHDLAANNIDLRSMQTLNEATEPYRQMAQHDLIDMAMTCHVVYPNSPDPATEAGFSTYWLQELRALMPKDRGLILSDCLNMGAITAKDLDMTSAVALCSQPDPTNEDAVTDLVLVTQLTPPEYQLLLEKIDHTPLPSVSKRLAFWYSYAHTPA